MNKLLHTNTRLVCLIAAVFSLSTVSFAQVKVITSGGFSAALQELVPDFEKTTGITVTIARGASQGSGPNTIGAQLRRGVTADVVILSREGLDDLIKEGRIVAGTDVDVAQTPLGLSVRAGAAKPNISTIDAFKRTLLQAKSVTFPESTTGIYMEKKMIPQLGIASQLAGKVTRTGVAAVATGDAEIAIQPVSELLHVPGSDFVGTIPQELQYISVFSTALVAGSKIPDASKRLITFLTSEGATKAIRNSGMEPVAPRK